MSTGTGPAIASTTCFGWSATINTYVGRQLTHGCELSCRSKGGTFLAHLQGSNEPVYTYALVDIANQAHNVRCFAHLAVRRVQTITHSEYPLTLEPYDCKAARMVKKKTMLAWGTSRCTKSSAGRYLTQTFGRSCHIFLAWQRSLYFILSCRFELIYIQRDIYLFQERYHCVLTMFRSAIGF